MRQEVGIISAHDPLVRRDDNARWRIVNRGKLGNGNVAGPFTGVGRSVVRHTAVARFSDRHDASGVITDVSIDVCVDNVLCWRGERLERCAGQRRDREGLGRFSFGSSAVQRSA